MGDHKGKREVGRRDGGSGLVEWRGWAGYFGDRGDWKGKSGLMEVTDVELTWRGRKAKRVFSG
ncbi:unnamed protein product [Prunus armeniaca]|uniref:Uncharacterized protein n=1 Tax=Prunus armeniaca TaxID=36596 RepID=A0A6J5X8F2_PRUAR|nr:unnamed protein product [Prunus armeniaca]